MKALFTMIVLIISSQPSYACDKEAQKLSLIEYTKSLKTNLLQMDSTFTTLAIDLKSSFDEMNAAVLNKETMDEGILSSLIQVNSELVMQTEAIYDTHMVLFEQFGEQPLDNNIYEQLLKCYPESIETLQAKIKTYIDSVNLDDSDVISILNTLFGYSTAILEIKDYLIIWLTANESENIPIEGLFGPIFDLSLSSERGPQLYGKDLLKESFMSWCEVLRAVAISPKECSGQLF